MVVVTIKTESNQKAQIPNMFCTWVSHYPDIGRGLTNCLRLATAIADVASVNRVTLMSR